MKNLFLVNSTHVQNTERSIIWIFVCKETKAALALLSTFQTHVLRGNILNMLDIICCMIYICSCKEKSSFHSFQQFEHMWWISWEKRFFTFGYKWELSKLLSFLTFDCLLMRTILITQQIIKTTIQL